jgi:hypothetical protein
VRSNNRHSLAFFLFLIPCLARGDYAWLPDYNHLILRVGGDYLSSSNNYGSDGTSTPLRTSGQLSTFKEYQFFTEAEYSFAKDWAASFKLPMVSAMIEGANQTLLNNSGLSEISLGLKWNLVPRKPMLTVEVSTKIPLYSIDGLTLDDLALGDGSTDIWGQLHIGYRLNRHFAGGISPGFLFRTSGYESAFTVTGFAGAAWNPIYMRLIVESFISTSKPQSFTVLSSNTTPGSGGSFALLSKSPDVTALGGKIGVFITPHYRLEGNAMFSVMGHEAPGYFKVGMNLIVDFDLYEPEPPKTKIKEVPFETEQQQPAEKPSSSETVNPATETPNTSN